MFMVHLFASRELDLTKRLIMTQIQIHSAMLREIAYTDKKTGKPASLLIQTAYLHAVDENGALGPVPDKFEIVLAKGVTTPFAPGMYTLHESSLYVSRDGKLTLNPRLVPVAKK